MAKQNPPTILPADEKMSTDPKVITNIEIIKQDPDFKKSVSTISKIEKSVAAIDIKDEASQMAAGDIRVNLRNAWKELDAKRKSFVDPLNKLKTKLQAEFKPKLDLIEDIVRKLDGKLLSYQQELDRKAEAERIRIEKANAKKLEKHNEKIESGKAAPPPVLKDVPEEPKNNIKTNSGTVNFREVTTWEIEDEDKIPDKYWKLDEVAIGKVVRAGGDIPGIKVIKTKGVASRG